MSAEIGVAFPKKKYGPKPRLWRRRPLSWMKAEVHAKVADIAFNYDWDWEAADPEYKRALDLDPDVSRSRPLFLFAIDR